jgi:hypothetical protein
MVTRQKRSDAFESLPEDMVYLKAKIKHLIEHTGLPEDEELEAQTGEPSDTRDGNAENAENAEPTSQDDVEK